MTYPTVLPRPIRSGYTMTVLSPIKRTKMDDGSSRTRRKILSNPRVMTLSWQLTGAERAIFEGWMKWDNNYGMNEVEVIVVGNETPLKVTCLDGNPSFKPAPGDNWQVSARFLEKRPKFVMPPKMTTLPVWPSGLPDYESDDYSIIRIDPTAMSDISKYATPVRRSRFKTLNVEYQVGVIVTAEQREIFYNFYYNTLIGGTGFFSAKYVNSMDDSNIRVKMASDPTEVTENGIFKITFTIETSEAKVMSRAAYQAAVGTDPAFANGYSDDYFQNDYVE